MGDRKTATAFFNQGLQANQQKGDDPKLGAHAYQLFASACFADPTWFHAYYQCGNNNSDLKLYFSAIADWRRALECEAPDKERAKACANLGWRLHTVGYTNEAEQVSIEAIKLDPTCANALMNLSMIYTVHDQPDRAVSCAEKAHALENSPMSEFNLAFAYLFNRQFAQGFKHFESRFPYRLKEYLQYPYPKWDGEPDKIVFLAADQGMGDTLSFARFVPELCRRSKYVIARIQAPLLKLFMHAFVGIKNLELIPAAYPFPAADAWTTFVSLPANLRLTDDEIRAAPPIEAGSWSVPNNWLVPDRKLHVGVAWAGSPLNDIDHHRNLPCHLFLEFFRVPGVQLYSLQVGDRAQDMHALGGGSLIRDVAPYITDVTDTLAILRRLDLVISVESFLPHLCSLVGKECWLPYSYLGRDYRLGCTGTDRLWTPNHRVFRQGPDLDWRPVFRNIVDALREKLDVRRAPPEA